MTLDEAIKHAEEVVEEHEKIKRIKAVTLEECNCAEEHRQLAEWLKDYKRLLEEQQGNDAISRKKVIDTIYCECSCENLDIDFAKVLLLQRAIKALPPVTPKSETVTEFADRCRECGAKYGKLLKQEPCGDAISRENTLKAMIEQLGIKNEDYLIPAEVTLYKVVKNMPPIQPQPKMGRWVKTPKAIMGDGYMWYCDKCKYEVYQDSSRPYPSERFCPNCGQPKMKEAEA